MEQFSVVIGISRHRGKETLTFQRTLAIQRQAHKALCSWHNRQLTWFMNWVGRCTSKENMGITMSSIMCHCVWRKRLLQKAVVEICILKPIYNSKEGDI